jgi:hemolysin activation/secretion protein
VIVFPVRIFALAVACSRLGLTAAVFSTLWITAARADAAHFEIDEYRVVGNTVLPPRDIEAAVYDFLGPDRAAEDVEKARAALEDLYQKRGYPTVTVEVPRQPAGSGIIRLNVVERRIGRLRVTNARYYEPDVIRAGAPSLAPGMVPYINDVKRDMIALNRWPGRAVAPELRAGRDPDTMDVDLHVTDQLPLRGSLELNNRQSSDTKPLRLLGSLGYDNLWQRGDSVGVFFQLAPQDTSNALVYAVSYTARIPGSDLSLVVSYLRSDSNVISLGGTDVVGKGHILGLRLVVPLAVPQTDTFSHSLTAGIDYKDFQQQLSLSGQGNTVPLTYYPVTIAYDANWTGKTSNTGLSIMTVFGTPELGDSFLILQKNRANATARFFYTRMSLNHLQELPPGMQLWVRFQGQASQDSLLPQEQFTAGGVDSVRGYLEAEALGDTGVGLQTELRSPSFAGAISSQVNELRVHLFADAARTLLNQPAPGQARAYSLASVGIGARARIADHASASVENAFVMSDALTTKHGADVVLFRVLGDF